MQNPDTSRLEVLQNEVHERIKEFDEIRLNLQKSLQIEYIGKLVKFPGKGWNVGYICDVAINSISMGVYDPLPIYISVLVGPEKNTSRGRCRRAELKDVELLTPEEIAERERVLNMHKRSNGNG